MSSNTDITLLLDQAVAGDEVAAGELFTIVYSELKQLAASYMNRESTGHTLQATALVHEVWIKLLGSQSEELEWNNRSHFFSAAAQAMRRILVDSAKARKRIKRGGGAAAVELKDDDAIVKQDDDLLALDEALELLRASDPQKAELVCLRYFAGFTNEQAAHQLGVSTATAERYWAYAKAWLRQKIEE